MWGRLGFKDVVDVNNVVFFIKFHNEEGLEYVINSGPWMVNFKPFFVLKWDIHVCLDKRDPEKLPIWIKLCNVPLEAYTTNGINALASRMTKPLVMDNVTTERCKTGFGIVRYARVLVEVSAKKTSHMKLKLYTKIRTKHKEEVCGKNKVVEIHDDNGKEVVQEQKRATSKRNENSGFTKVRNRKVNEAWNRGKNSNRNYKQVQGHGMGVQKDKPVNQFVFHKKNKEGPVMNNTPNNSPINVVSNANVLDDKNISPNGKLDTNQDAEEISDVYEDVNGIAQGMKNDILEVRKFIDDESLSMINVGWNSDLVDMNVVHYGEQSILCKMEAVKCALSMFCIIVYAANGGDINVTMDPKEHSYGSSTMTKDMIDFKECVNEIEVKDVTTSGLFFTWTKNLYKTKIEENPSILKKLDRVMVNEALISKYRQVHEIFLPYLISNHCLVVLANPNLGRLEGKLLDFLILTLAKKNSRMKF
ncbi:RNA-directed DNA polymerase, eukaryota, reverse transcriptase zinc-binding domain protein [Tanacetum coccineum]